MFRLKTVICLLVLPAAAAAQTVTVNIPASVFSVQPQASAAESSGWRFVPLPGLQTGKPLEDPEGPRIDLRPRPVDVAGLRQEPPVVRQRQVAIEYSRGYEIRRRIHVITSLAMLPLFATEVVLGQRLYDGTAGSGTRSAHGAVAGGIAAVFGINTVTGAWNLWEGRKDPAGRTRRLTHALLMLAANAGFVATASLAPESEHGEIEGNRGQHRAVALTSMGLATASYLIMLVGR